MPFEGQLLEVRSNREGFLDEIPELEVSFDESFEGAFSFVLPEETGRSRRLPGIYMGKTLFHADRRAETVADAFRWMAGALHRSLDVPTYTLHSIRVDSNYGLYARDFFNRSAFRRSLARAGVEFHRHPFSRFVGDAFEADDWGRFEPSFLIMSNPDPEELGPIFMSRAELSFAIGTYRIGALDGEEIRSLTQVAMGMKGMAGEDVQRLIGAIVTDGS